jgi:methylenetetrahydrofolate dehydrogenase (NADP+)/methenyltetrahydrofolate cyclohydrolase
MAAKLMDGRRLSTDLRAQAQRRVAALAARGVQVTVSVVRVGDDPASAGYARSLAKTFGTAGAALTEEVLPADAPAAAVGARLAALSADPRVHGIMLQEPVPAGLDAAQLVLALAPEKDIDGVHPLNAGRLFQGRPDGLVPATALGGLLLLEQEGLPLAGARAVVIGRSAIVGRPLALLLLHRHATVTICHTRTRDLAAVAREADLLAVAVGRAGFVTTEFVAPGATVLDFGTNYLDGRVLGDVDPAVAEVAGALSPTPGGTGAVTTAVLLHNAVLAAERLTVR